ncbi:glycogen/starch synthase [Haloplasma contractile]|uniref:Glycogen synthase n=1 Tax=Haloplasma contractile SSD-17B TaxID=1033810 RepID=U2DRA9_9MOLU|nr:glycogen/starch synthase [Haloplasma contractile]ERJ11112.1 Glycogen synthase protein [Haloplasma contractile SSD-17B]
MKNDLLGIIDASILCKGLEPLTIPRLPSAIPFGAKYRLIDFALSNLINSGVRNVAIFPNANYRSLYDHVGSGKAWELDRKRDGLFILPPLEMVESSEKMITFDRIKEHLEYLTRSTQTYVIVTCGVIVWNIDFNTVLKDHIRSDADITEVLHQNKRLGTFLLKKELLIELVLRCDYLGFRHLYDVSAFSHDLTFNYFYHKSYTKKINSIYEYYKANMDMLNFDIGKTIFTTYNPILTKTKDSAPTLYGQHADVLNSIIANGATILGEVSGSVISRDVIINEGSTVKNSIVMQGSTIKKHAVLEHCILDKRVTIGENVVLKGTRDKPLVIKKEDRLLNNDHYKILHVASECYPFIKTGGLADVIGSLPKEQRSLGTCSLVCIPLYKTIEESYSKCLQLEITFNIHFKNKEVSTTLYTLKKRGLTYYLLKVGDYFNRDRPYDYDDDFERFYLFNKAVVELLNLGTLTPDLVHVHDWHAGLLPLLIKENQLEHIRSILTIHNLAYQGIFHNEHPVLHDSILKHNDINFLEIAIENANRITTVSETYSKEIQHAYFGEGLNCLIKSRAKDLSGILNGIDLDVYNPETDSNLIKNYNVKSYQNKIENKIHLQYTCNLKVDKSIPIISMITRLVEQKGIDLLLAIFDELMAETNIQLILLGSGNKNYETILTKLEKKYPNRVRIYIGYDSFNANRLYAGSDLFLMPSRFEPCGLSQLIALRYGTIPIVRETGGLNDTVKSYNEFMRTGNGFSFTNYNAHDMKYTIKRALTFYKNGDHWDHLVITALSCNFSWKQSAIKYDHLYRELLKI